MSDSIIGLFLIIAIGVIIADLVKPSNVAGTKALFTGVTKLWCIGVQGMLGGDTSKC